MRKQYVLFDLDGTLTDPGVGITKSVQYALKSYGIDVPDLSVLYPFIGPPLKDSFMKYYGFSPEKSMEAIGRYREYFTTAGMFENVVYDGIPQMLTHLKAAGKTLLVATSKPEAFAVQILEHFHLMSYFAFVGGASMDEVRVKKSEVIEYILESVCITDRSQAVMVGDREYDVFGARQCGIDTIGVLFGYGSRKELEQAEAWKIAGTVEELEKLLLEC